MDKCKHQEPFSLLDRLGNYQLARCCCREKPSAMAKQVGIGPTMFLLSTKAMSFFFFFLTILNLPVLYVYYNGSRVNSEASGGVQVESFTDQFIKFSLGNIGQSSLSCASANLAHESKITLTCGGYSKLGKMRRVGLIKNNDENCNTIAYDERSMRNSLAPALTQPGGSFFEIPE